MRINKWIKEYVIQEYTGYGRGGWEDSTTEENIKDARVNLKLYRENSPIPSRLIIRNVINPQWEELQKEN